jgi:hypothetical protein
MARHGRVALLACAVAALLAAALATVSVTSVRDDAALTAEFLASRIALGITYTDPTIRATYVDGSAFIIGKLGDPPAQSVLDQIGVFDDALGTLLTSRGDGVILSSGGVTNLETGLRPTFDPAFDFSSPPNPVDSLLLDIDDVVPDRWGNGVALSFEVFLPAGTFAVTYTFCTNRLEFQFDSKFDAVVVGLEGVNVTFPNSNLALGTNGFQMTPVYQFAEGEGLPGPDYGLPSSISRCLAAQQATAVITTAGVYELRFSASNQNDAGETVADGRAEVFLLVNIGDEISYPDNYDPSFPLFTGTDEVVTLDTWCNINVGTSINFIPGFRVEGVNAGPSDEYCCRLKGRFNGATSQCDVLQCVGPATPYDDYLSFSDLSVSSDCYTDCYTRDAFYGSDPFVDLTPNLLEVYDGRFKTLEQLVGTAFGATYTYGVSAKRGLLIFEQDASTNGFLITSGGIEYMCSKFGTLFDDQDNVLVGCDLIDTNFLCVSNSIGSACYTNCYVQVPGAPV